MVLPCKAFFSQLFTQQSNYHLYILISLCWLFLGLSSAVSSSHHLIFPPPPPFFHSWSYHFQYLCCYFTLSFEALIWLYFQRGFQLTHLPVSASFFIMTLCSLCFSSFPSPFLPSPSFQSSLTRSIFHPLLVYLILCICHIPSSVSNLECLFHFSFQYNFYVCYKCVLKGGQLRAQEKQNLLLDLEYDPALGHQVGEVIIWIL